MAVHHLVVGEGTIKQRLFDAAVEIVMVSQRDLPHDLREDFAWVEAAVTKNPSKPVTGTLQKRIVGGSTGRLGATIPYMRVATAVKVAERICYIEARLRDVCAQP